MREQDDEIALLCEGSSSQWLYHNYTSNVLRSARQESHTLILVFTCIVQRKRMWSCGEDLSSADQQSNQARGDSESYGRTSVE